ncbi:MAG: FG-GAP repeat domain-containing protein, partial [Waterburya sp.]
MFKDVSDSSGIVYQGSSYGAAWGDFNNDGFIDLWVSNHGSGAILYQNQGNGTFNNVTLKAFEQQPRADFHGAAWADFDNDGDSDLIQLVGADAGKGNLNDPKLANRLFINQNGTFIDQGIDLGLGYISSRGRTPLWFDYNKDRLLDLLQGAAERSDGKVPATIFKQGEQFTDLRSSLGFDLGGTQFGILSDLVGDNTPELILLKPRSGISIYDSTNISDITDSVLTSNYQAQDFISEDFNGDLLPDLYLTRR